MQPLEGVQVVELGTGIAAGYAGKLLVDLGATVTRLERDDRGVGQTEPASLRRYHDTLSAFLDSGKSSITDDQVPELRAKADIAITTETLAGLRERWGIDPEAFAHEGSILLSITSFGLREQNPEKLMPDLLATALSGFLLLTGDLAHPPARNQASLPQFQAAIAGVMGALGALLVKEAGGGGDVVDVSLYESTAFLMEREDIVYTHQGQLWQRTPRHMVVHPFTILPCRDGYVALAVAGPQMFKSLCELIEQPEMGDNMEIVMNRVQHADEIDAVLVPWLAEHDRAEVASLMQERRIPVTPVLDFRELLDDAHMRSREFFRVLSPENPVLVPGLPYRLTEGR